MRDRVLNLSLAGSTHCPGSSRLISRALGCRSGSLRAVRLTPEPDNPYDPNAIVVECQGRRIGYVSARQAATLASILREGGRAAGRLVSRRALEVRIFDAPPDP